MKKAGTWDKAEPHRMRLPKQSPFYSAPGDPYGVFNIPGPNGKDLRCVVSMATESEPFDHVSVSTKNRCPNWPEMCFIKDIFFDGEECAMQLHVPQSDHINNHPYCLHIWRPIAQLIPRPPGYMVGVKGVEPAEAKPMFEKALQQPDGLDKIERRARAAEYESMGLPESAYIGTDNDGCYDVYDNPEGTPSAKYIRADIVENALAEILIAQMFKGLTDGPLFKSLEGLAAGPMIGGPVHAGGVFSGGKMTVFGDSGPEAIMRPRKDGE